jgi:hypothetical protein
MGVTVINAKIQFFKFNMGSYGDFYFVAINKKKMGIQFFNENFNDWSCNCPQQNGIKNLGVLVHKNQHCSFGTPSLALQIP